MLLKNTYMKILLLAFVLTFSLSCSKDNGDTCWDCRITVNGQDEYRKVCGDGNTPPQIYDSNGNPYSQFCTRR